MIDMHCHILPGIDDGSKSLDESVQIIKTASHCGVTDLVFTPHFIYESIYNADNEKKRRLFEQVKEVIKNANININLYLGNEVFVENNMLELLQDNKIYTINGSNYLLFELPMNNTYNGIYDLIFKLKNAGIIPIIAHPERYSLFQRNPEVIIKMLEQGALFQSNLGSFYGHYGKEAKNLVLLLLKHNMIHFISSDTHHTRDEFYNNIEEVKKIMKKYILDEQIENLLVNNAKCVLKNEKFEVEDFIPFSKTIFGKIK